MSNEKNVALRKRNGIFCKFKAIVLFRSHYVFKKGYNNGRRLLGVIDYRKYQQILYNYVL